MFQDKNEKAPNAAAKIHDGFGMGVDDSLFGQNRVYGVYGPAPVEGGIQFPAKDYEAGQFGKTDLDQAQNDLTEKGYQFGQSIFADMTANDQKKVLNGFVWPQS